MEYLSAVHHRASNPRPATGNENGSTNAFFTTGAFFCRAAVALGLVVCLKTLLIVGVGDRTSPVAVLPFLRSTLLLFGIDVS
jgi:hypothetical protein